MIAASVRLRIEDADGHSCGSGTIIDARQGQALVLTCGHIFRDSKGKGRVEVDLFSPDGVRRVVGNLISYNLDRDVALLSIRTPGPVTTARVAPAGYRLRPGNPAVTVGCNHGSPPSARHTRVTSVDRYRGPPNVQVAGQSVEGRSGGGLFSAEGLVIGVCNAAEPIDNESFYAALGAVQTELDEAGLSHIYNAPKPQPAEVTPRAALVAVDPPPMPERMPSALAPAIPAEFPSVEPPRRPEPALAGGSSRLSAAERAALEEIRRRLDEGAEVICVVRSRRNPAAKSEIIMLEKVSPEFLKHLAAEARSQDSRQLTSWQLPRKPARSPNWSGDPAARRARQVEPSRRP